MLTWIYTLTSVIAVSLVAFVGIGTLIFTKERLKRVLFYMVSFAVGGLFGDAFIHLLPESFETFGFGLKVPLFVVLGILIFFSLEKFIRWRHCHADPCECHAHPVAAMNIVGDAAHNLIDGMLIGASFEVSVSIGVATSIAIILHEIPHEMGNFGVLVHSGMSVKKALLFNFLSAMVAIVGAVISLLIGPIVHGYAYALMPITAGGFIYVAGSDLIPELHHEVRPFTSLMQLICILFGIAIMSLMTL